jgi:UDP-galactopyranose mutase
LTEYQKLASSCPDVIFGGRLGAYAYYNMDQVVEKALEAADLALAPVTVGPLAAQDSK